MSKNVSSPLPPHEITLENYIIFSSSAKILWLKTVDTANYSRENPLILISFQN